MMLQDLYIIIDKYFIKLRIDVWHWKKPTSLYVVGMAKALTDISNIFSRLSPEICVPFST